MSTKIYTAWKVPIHKLNKFIDMGRKKMLKCAATQAIIFTNNFTFDQIISGAKLAAQGMERVPLDFECGFNIWLDNEWAYIMPMIGEALHKLRDDSSWKFPRWVGDYAYYNSTDDQLETMSEKEWRDRGKKWDKLLDRTRSRNLYHSVLDFSHPPFNDQITLLNAVNELLQERKNEVKETS
jgi:hypothetical protein